MRAAKTSVFLQAIVIAVLALKHEWAWFVAPLAIIHLAYHWLASPQLVQVDHGQAHTAVHDRHSLTYRLHHRHSPPPPEMPKPSKGYTPGGWS